MNYKDYKEENKLIPYLLAFLSFFLYFAPSYISYLSLLVFLMPLSLAPLFIGFYKYGTNFLYYILLFFALILAAIYFVGRYIGAVYSVGIIIKSIYFIIVAIIPGIIYNFTLVKKYEIKKSYSIFIYYSLLVVIVILILLNFKPISELVTKNLQMADNQLTDYIKELKMNKVPDKVVEQYMVTKNMVFDTIKNFFPSLIFMSLMFYFTLNLLIGKLFISRYYDKEPSFVELFKIRPSEYLIWLFIVSWGLLLVSLMFHFKIITNILFNLSIIISTLYFIRGISMVIFRLLLLNISFLSKSILLGAIFIILIISNKFFLAGIIFFMGIGVLDYWIDFVKFDKKV